MFVAFVSSGCVQRNPFWIYLVGSTKNHKTDIGDGTFLVAVVLFSFFEGQSWIRGNKAKIQVVSWADLYHLQCTTSYMVG